MFIVDLFKPFWNQHTDPNPRLVERSDKENIQGGKEMLLCHSAATHRQDGVGDRPGQLG